MARSATVELTVTGWPHRGEPQVLAGPTTWPVNFPEDDVTRLNAHIAARTRDNWGEIQLRLAGLYPADPGWLAASAELLSVNGAPLGRMRPVRLYGRQNDIGSHIYFPAEFEPWAFSCQLRVIAGGL